MSLEIFGPLTHGSLFSGELVGVVGAVGTGKSSVLAALLGELEKTGGRIALDRPPQGTRAAPQVLVFFFRKMGAASGFTIRVRIQAGRNCPSKGKIKKKNFLVNIQG